MEWQNWGTYEVADWILTKRARERIVWKQWSGQVKRFVSGRCGIKSFTHRVKIQVRIKDWGNQLYFGVQSTLHQITGVDNIKVGVRAGDPLDEKWAAGRSHHWAQDGNQVEGRGELWVVGKCGTAQCETQRCPEQFRSFWKREQGAHR